MFSFNGSDVRITRSEFDRIKGIANDHSLANTNYNVDKFKHITSYKDLNGVDVACNYLVIKSEKVPVMLDEDDKLPRFAKNHSPAIAYKIGTDNNRTQREVSKTYSAGHLLTYGIDKTSQNTLSDCLQVIYSDV